VSSLFLGRDYTDPYFATGARLHMTRSVSPNWDIGIELVGEQHRDAYRTQETTPFDDGRTFRAVRGIDEGDVSMAIFGLRRPMPDPRADDWGAGLDIEVGAFAGSYYLRPVMHASLLRGNADHSRDVIISGSAGIVTGDAPSQRIFLLGGAGTLPGYPFRSFGGHRYALVDAQLSQTVIAPWIRVRAVGALGIAGASPDFDPVTDPATRAWQTWDIEDSDGLRASLGGGVSLFWDVLRIDAVRGINGGDWRAVFTFHPDLLDIG
jgi:hypothetical protein